MNQQPTQPAAPQVIGCGGGGFLILEFNRHLLAIASAAPDGDFLTTLKDSSVGKQWVRFYLGLQYSNDTCCDQEYGGKAGLGCFHASGSFIDEKTRLQKGVN